MPWPSTSAARRRSTDAKPDLQVLPASIRPAAPPGHACIHASTSLWQLLARSKGPSNAVLLQPRACHRGAALSASPARKSLSQTADVGRPCTHRGLDVAEELQARGCKAETRGAAQATFHGALLTRSSSSTSSRTISNTSMASHATIRLRSSMRACGRQALQILSGCLF